jgi:hypothetical protein
MPPAFMGLVAKQVPCVGKPQKKPVRDCRQSSSFFGGGGCSFRQDYGRP